MVDLLNDVFPKVLTAASKQLNEELPILNCVTREFEKDMKGQNDLIWVPKMTESVAQDVVPGHVASNSPDIRMNAVPVMLSEWKECAFDLTDWQLKQITNGVIPEVIISQVRGLRNAITKTIWDNYKQSYFAVGTAGTTPFNPDTDKLTIARDARKILNRTLANSIDRERHMLLHTDAEANATLLPEFLNSDKAGTDQTIRDGVIGQKLGFQWNFDNSDITHAINNLTNRTGHTVSAPATTISITNAYLPKMNPVERNVVTLTVPVGTTGGCKKGDLFKVQGDPNFYCVDEDSNVSGTSLQVQFSPKPKSPWSASAAVTWIGEHAVSLAMRQGAIALVMAPFTKPTEIKEIPGRVSMTYIDPVTRIPLRMEFYGEYKQTRFSLDALWGSAVIERSHLVRVLG